MNPEILKKDIELIKKYVEEIKQTGLSKPAHIEVKFLEDHSELYNKYVFLTKKIISGDDLSMLEKMMNSIKIIDTSSIKSQASTKYQEEIKLGKELAEKYLPKNLKE